MSKPPPQTRHTGRADKSAPAPALQPHPTTPPATGTSTDHARQQELRAALQAPVSQDRIVAGLTEQDARDVADLQERLDRLTGDTELLEDLAIDGFTGPRWDVAAYDLSRYAMSVTSGWLATGHIFKLTADRGFQMHPSPDLLHALATDKDLRQDLAVMTVAKALPRFRQKAFIERGWDPAKGAGINTYFMGACVFEFPNELRRHTALNWRWQRQDLAEGRTLPMVVDPSRGPITDPATIATGNVNTIQTLQRASTRERRILAAKIEGYTYEEMTEMFDETSERAIEGVVYRWRTEEQTHLREGRTP